MSLLSSPGVYYDPDSGAYLLNLIGGAGYFVADGLALGLDLGYQRSSVASDSYWYGTIAPFVKVVTGLDEGKLGFFAEASPGMLFTNDRLLGRGKHFVLGGWAGLNVPFGRSLSLMTGPSIVGVGNVGSNGGFPAVVGWRLGISVYLSGPEKKPQVPVTKTASKLPPFELRLHSASHVAGGGGVLGATAGRGVFYGTRSKTTLANFTGGGAAYLKPWLGFGFDFAMTELAGRFEAGSLSFAPFVKVVSGMESRTLGIFFEASPGIVLARYLDRDDPELRTDRWANLVFQGWGGAHVPVGRSAAFVAGPAVGWAEDMDRFGRRGSGYVGFRFGVSAYVP